MFCLETVSVLFLIIVRKTSKGRVYFEHLIGSKNEVLVLETFNENESNEIDSTSITKTLTGSMSTATASKVNQESV